MTVMQGLGESAQAAGRLLATPRARLVAGGTAGLLLAIGLLTAPSRPAPTAGGAAAGLAERTAPLLEAELQRRASLQAFERIQELGSRVIGYSVALGGTAPDAPPVQSDATLAPLSVLPRGFGVPVGAGLILTHAAALQSGERIEVRTASGTALAASVAAFDPATGGVLLRVPDGELPLPPLTPRTLGAGTLITAAGRWNEQDVIAPVFIVSAGPGQYTVSGATPLPPGTPLFTVDGELAAVLAPTGIAVQASPMVERLLAQASGAAGLPVALGLSLQSLQPALAPWFGDRGALVADVSGADAWRAGLRPGDALVAVDGELVETVLVALEALRNAPAGRERVLTVSRDGRDLTLRATMSPRLDVGIVSMAEAAPATAPLVRSLVPALQPRVEPGALTRLVGMGDVIVLAVNRRPVATLAEATRALPRRGPVLLYVERDGVRWFAPLAEVAR